MPQQALLQTLTFHGMELAIAEAVLSHAIIIGKGEAGDDDAALRLVKGLVAYDVPGCVAVSVIGRAIHIGERAKASQSAPGGHLAAVETIAAPEPFQVVHFLAPSLAEAGGDA